MKLSFARRFLLWIYSLNDMGFHYAHKGYGMAASDIRALRRISVY